ncbi:hypothetical protein MHYP_G00093630 [Metynnis hypsauchen]
MPLGERVWSSSLPGGLCLVCAQTLRLALFLTKRPEEEMSDLHTTKTFSFQTGEQVSMSRVPVHPIKPACVDLDAATKISEKVWIHILQTPQRRPEQAENQRWKP